jgi:hypothetical protein
MRAWGRSGAAALGGVILAAALAGCGPTAPMPIPTDDATGVPSPSASPISRELNLDGTAQDNLPYFYDTIKATVESGASLDGRTFIDALVEAGFPKEAMELTPDRTSINAEADTIQFSVRINGTCLIGQYGANGDYNGDYATLLADGKCLIGTTRPIDW